MSYNIDFEPLGRRISYTGDANLDEIARQAGITLNSNCGGQRICGLCKVRVLTGLASPITNSEREHLTADELAAGLRLACATRPCSDLKLEIPSGSLVGVQRLQVEGAETAVTLDPAVVPIPVALPQPALDRPLADWDNLHNCLLGQLPPEPHIDITALRRLSPLLREAGWQIAAVVRDGEIIDVRRQGDPVLGIAVDLGTTKIAAYLVDLMTGETLAARGAMNPQIGCGEDVMSRISYARRSGGAALQQSVVETLNNLIGELDPGANRALEMVLVGNTAMHHLFLGLPVQQLGRAPYVPAVQHSLDVKARDLGLDLAPGAYVHLLPNIAGFVGADHVAMLLATGLYESERPVIGIDIGTNTEVALAVRGEVRSTSCASGPALEGAEIKHGMRASSGAVEKVEIQDGRVLVGTIDGALPVGICGSGIIDAVYQLYRSGIVDERGRLQPHPLVRDSAEGREFILVPAASSGTEGDIVVSQQDIGEVQLAKAAIRTGINILLREAEVTEDELAKVVIAGAFGSYINVASAVGIGMLPDLPGERFRQVGNAAGVGARMALLSRHYRETAEELAGRVHYIELTVHPQFSREYAHALPFAPLGVPESTA